MCLCLYASSQLSLCVYLQAVTCFWKGQRFDCILVFYSTIRYECTQPTIQHLLPAADLIFRNITKVHVSNTLATAATRAPPVFPSAPPLNHNSGALCDIVTCTRLCTITNQARSPEQPYLHSVLTPPRTHR